MARAQTRPDSFVAVSREGGAGLLDQISGALTRRRYSPLRLFAAISTKFQSRFCRLGFCRGSATIPGMKTLLGSLVLASVLIFSACDSQQPAPQPAQNATTPSSGY